MPLLLRLCPLAVVALVAGIAEADEALPLPACTTTTTTTTTCTGGAAPLAVPAPRLAAPPLRLSRPSSSLVRVTGPDATAELEARCHRQLAIVGERPDLDGYHAIVVLGDNRLLVTRGNQIVDDEPLHDQPIEALCHHAVRRMIELAAALAAAQPLEPYATAEPGAEQHQILGERLLQFGDPRGALRELRHAYDLRPTVALALRLGELYESVGEAASALALYQHHLDDGTLTQRAFDKRAARVRAPSPSSSRRLAWLAVPIGGTLFSLATGIGFLVATRPPGARNTHPTVCYGYGCGGW